MSFLKTLKKADIYRDIPRDFTEQTLAGAIGASAPSQPAPPFFFFWEMVFDFVCAMWFSVVSTGCIFIIAWLFVSETFEFLTPRTSLKFSVENPLVNSGSTATQQTQLAYIKLIKLFVYFF